MDVVKVVASAPVRVADVGGWTDTWFGSPGRVCHIGVGPGVTVEVRVGRGGGAVVVDAPALGQPWAIVPGPEGTWAAPGPGRDLLVEHAVGAVLSLDGAADRLAGRGVEIGIGADVPLGASLGTSAAVLVALLAALDGAVHDRARPPAELAAWAHTVETEGAARQAGVQDHWAAACGGAALLAVGPYPEVRRTEVPLTAATQDALVDGVVTVVFGAHDSSAVHESVIHSMVSCGGAEHEAARHALRSLAALAGEAATALGEGDLEAWGAVLTEATERQRALHADLVGPAHERAIELARAHGATGWKVNGAGGSGGSLTVFAPGAANQLAAAYRAEPGWVVPLLHPARGVLLS